MTPPTANSNAGHRQGGYGVLPVLPTLGHRNNGGSNSQNASGKSLSGNKRRVFKKRCAVFNCTTSSTKNPEMIFVFVPRYGRERRSWLKKMETSFPVKKMYCCELHFNLEEDCVNYEEYKQYKQQSGGTKKYLKLKKGVLPHRNLPTISEDDVSTSDSMDSLPFEQTDMASNPDQAISEVLVSGDHFDKESSSVAVGTEEVDPFQSTASLFQPVRKLLLDETIISKVPRSASFQSSGQPRSSDQSTSWQKGPYGPYQYTSRGIPFVPASGTTSKAATGMNDVASLSDEPDNDSLDYEVELIDMDAVSCKEEIASPDPHRTTPQSSPFVSTFGALDEPATDGHEVELADMDAVPSYTNEAGPSSELESSLVPELDPIEIVPQKIKHQRQKSPGYQNKVAPLTTLSIKEEREIVKSMKDMARRGFPITRRRIECTVSSYLKAHPTKTPFKNNKPGKTWIRCFLKRNPDIKIKKNLSPNDPEQGIRNWFRDILSYLEHNQLADILKDPSRILNSYEAGFMLQLPSKGVVEQLHKQNVSFIETTTGNHNITVMITLVANGSFVSPYVVLPIKRLTQEIQQSFPNDWGLVTSDNGWMDVRNFKLYVEKVLYPTLVKRGTKFPVLYFVKGYDSNLTYEAADICKPYGIILIAMYPNAAQILQKSSVAALNPLKTTWASLVRSWRLDNKAKRMTLTSFGALLKESVVESLNKSTITNGFTVSGLYPFDPNAIDFKEYCTVSAGSQESSNEGIANTEGKEEMSYDSVSTMDIVDESKDRYIEVPESVLKTALNMLGPSKINLYRTTTLADDLSPEDKVLSYVYKNILILGESPAHGATQETSNNPSTSEDGGIFKPASLAPDDDIVKLEFDVTMDIKTESDSEESTDMIVGFPPP